MVHGPRHDVEELVNDLSQVLWILVPVISQSVDLLVVELRPRVVDAETGLPALLVEVPEEQHGIVPLVGDDLFLGLPIVDDLVYRDTIGAD